MYLVDFEYDGRLLSSLGYMVGCINTDKEDTVSLGSSLSYETVVNNGTYVTEYPNYSYEENITKTFDIIKFSCENPNEIYFSSSEISYIMRWLNQETIAKFIPIYDELQSETVFFNGTFTSVSAIKINGNVAGFTVTFTSNAPWGFLDSRDLEMELDGVESYSIFQDSDRVGCVYPTKLEMTIHADGDLELANSLDPRICKIANVKEGEIITMNCEARTIVSSEDHKTLYNDFNYCYPRIINNKYSEMNVFTSTLPVSIVIEHHPIRKVGIL